MGFFSLSRNVGIDLGTSRTRVYVPNRGVVFDEPSVLALSANGSDLLCIGKAAGEMIGRVSGGEQVHDIVIRGMVQNEHIAERFLREIFSKISGFFKFFRRDAVVGVPTNATGMQRRAIMQVCRRAGLRNVFTECNTILAAAGAGMYRDDLRGRMVADIGAGFTEASVISLGGAGSGSSVVHVGGNDMDRSIVSYVEQEYGLLISEETARKVKERVGSAVVEDESREVRVKGNDARDRLPKILRITSNDIAHAVREETDAILHAVASVFRETSPDLTSDIIDNGLILTGGVAKMHGLDTEISRFINVPVHVADESGHAVIRGIRKSIQSGHLHFHKMVMRSK